MCHYVSCPVFAWLTMWSSKDRDHSFLGSQCDPRRVITLTLWAHNVIQRWGPQFWAHNVIQNCGKPWLWAHNVIQSQGSPRWAHNVIQQGVGIGCIRVRANHYAFWAKTNTLIKKKQEKLPTSVPFPRKKHRLSVGIKVFLHRQANFQKNQALKNPRMDSWQENNSWRTR